MIREKDVTGQWIVVATIHWPVTSVLLFLLVACNAAPATYNIAVNSPLFGPYTFTLPSQRKPTGELTLGDINFPMTANPLFASSDSDLRLDNALWGRPVFFDQHFHVHPDQLSEVPLPENGGVLDGGKTIILHLRHDLRWSDGEPISADDFQYWWSLNQDPNTGATITSGYDQIARIETPDQYTVVLHMKEPFGPYLFYLPYAAPKHAWSQWPPIALQNTQAVYQIPQVTSGPYEVLNMLAGQRYTLVPNPYYTSTTFHGPYLARLNYQAYRNMSELLAAIQQQEVAVAPDDSDDGQPLTQLPAAMHVLQSLAASYEHLDFNMAQPLLQDIRVRKAIAFSLDICTIVKTVLREPDCQRRVTQVEPQPSLYYDATIQPSAYDPATARSLLAQAGWQPDQRGLLWKDGQPCRVRLVTTEENPLRMALAQEIQRALGLVGIQVQIEYYHLRDFFGGYTQSGTLATGTYDLALFTYANSPEPDEEYSVFHSSQIPDATHPDLGNYGRIRDTIIDQSLMQGRYGVTFAERRVAYHRFLERLAEQEYIIPLYQESTMVIASEHVHNVVSHPDQSAMTWNIPDWWLA